MTEEKSIDLTQNEILMIQMFCKECLAKNPAIADQANPIIEKLSAIKLEPSDTMLGEQTILRKQRKPWRTAVEQPNEVFQLSEVEPINAAPEVLEADTETDKEPLQLTAHVNIELIESEPVQITNLHESKPKVNFFQQLLQKLRPAARQ